MILLEVTNNFKPESFPAIYITGTNIPLHSRLEHKNISHTYLTYVQIIQQAPYFRKGSQQKYRGPCTEFSEIYP